MIPNTETLVRHINQNGVRPGPRKLEQFKKALTLRGVPKLYSQENKGEDATVFVKIFNPAGSGAWFITEWDGEDTCFGFIATPQGKELGYMSVEELASVEGRLGIGLEIEVWFLPTTLKEVRKEA